jgi:hypothetical protein
MKISKSFVYLLFYDMFFNMFLTGLVVSIIGCRKNW